MFGLHCIINIQQFPLCTATSQHGHFPNHDLHCSDMKAICWPFRSWTLSLKHTQTCVWVSHTEWSSEGTQWCSTIPWFNSEHMSFQHSHALSLIICVANTVSYTAVTYSCLCIWWMWEFAASNVDAHANKQTITATCLNYRFQLEFLVCFLSSTQ